MTQPQTYHQRTQGAGMTHITGRDGDEYYTLCGRNMQPATSWEEKGEPGDLPSYAYCQRCMTRWKEMGL